MKTNLRSIDANIAPLGCFIAHTAQDRAQVYRLRYACYRRKGSIDPTPDEQFSDHFDEAPNNFSFLVRSPNEEPVATVRISVVRPDLGWTDSPVRHVYGDHPVLQAIAGDSFVEASRLCFGRQARRDAFVGLVANMAALAQFYDVGWMVACPRVEHSPVYQRMFGFKPLAPPRQYFGVKFETQLLGVRREELRAYVSDARPMMSAWSDAFANLIQSRALPMLQAV
jgi:hypothetical protein